MREKREKQKGGGKSGLSTALRWERKTYSSVAWGRASHKRERDHEKKRDRYADVRKKNETTKKVNLERAAQKKESAFGEVISSEQTPPKKKKTLYLLRIPDCFIFSFDLLWRSVSGHTPQKQKSASRANTLSTKSVWSECTSFLASFRERTRKSM